MVFKDRVASMQTHTIIAIIAILLHTTTEPLGQVFFSILYVLSDYQSMTSDPLQSANVFDK